MKCVKCDGRDFDLVRASIANFPYVECYHCRKGYFVGTKLALRPVELLGEIPQDLGDAILLDCKKCNALRIVHSTGYDLMLNSQFCNECINTQSFQPVMLEKISWAEFMKGQMLD